MEEKQLLQLTQSSSARFDERDVLQLYAGSATPAATYYSAARLLTCVDARTALTPPSSGSALRLHVLHGAHLWMLNKL